MVTKSPSYDTHSKYVNNILCIKNEQTMLPIDGPIHEQSLVLFDVYCSPYVYFYCTAETPVK